MQTTPRSRRRSASRRQLTHALTPLIASLIVPSVRADAARSAEGAPDLEHLELEPVVAGSPLRIEVFPRRIELRGSRDRVQLVVTAYYHAGEGASPDDGPRIQDLTRVARFVAANGAIAAVEGSVVVPRGNGRTVLRVSAAGREIRVPVDVSGQEHRAVSFRYETLPALSKKGCSSGACHGSPSGKGGFRLSLRAFDPELDERTLIREYGARRTNPIKVTTPCHHKKMKFPNKPILNCHFNPNPGSWPKNAVL